MFLNLTLASGHTSPIIASDILNLTLAYLPCSRALQVKCRLLLEDIITSPNIDAWHKFRQTANILAIQYSRNRNRLLYEQSFINTALYSYRGCCIVRNVQKAPCILNANLEKLEKLRAPLDAPLTSLLRLLFEYVYRSITTIFPASTLLK